MKNIAMKSQDDHKEEFYYPTGYGILRSTDEYRSHYLPMLYDPDVIDPRLKCCLDLVQKNTAKTGAWLDYGCGGGVFVHHLAKRMAGWTSVGWEGDYSSFEIADKCFALQNTAFERRPYIAYREMPKAEFDGISFLEVVEHVDNPGEILSSFYSALKPGGRLLVSTPNFLGWSAVSLELRRVFNELIGRRNRKGYVDLMNDRKYDPATEAGHISLYSFPTLTMLLKLHGFELADFAIVPSSKKLKHRLFPDTLVVMGRKVGQEEA